MNNFLCFSHSKSYPVIMIEEASSYLIVITDRGLERFATVNPQPNIDYDESGNHIKVVGVDMV